MEFIFRRSYRGAVKAVVLDWAGTAVDYGSFAPTAVFLRLFESRGVKITPADARSGMGLMKKDHLRTILARPAVAESWITIHGRLASEKDVDDLFNDFVPMQLAVLKEYAEPIPGLLDVIKEIRENGVKIGSTTGYIRSMMDVLAPESPVDEGQRIVMVADGVGGDHRSNGTSARAANKTKGPGGIPLPLIK